MTPSFVARLPAAVLGGGGDHDSALSWINTSGSAHAQADRRPGIPAVRCLCTNLCTRGRKAVDALAPGSTSAMDPGPTLINSSSTVCTQTPPLPPRSSEMTRLPVHWPDHLPERTPPTRSRKHSKLENGGDFLYLRGNIIGLKIAFQLKTRLFTPF